MSWQTAMHTRSRGGKPWGLWATLGLSVVVIGLFVALQGLAGGLLALAGALPGPAEEAATRLEANGLFITVATLLASLCCLGLVAWLAGRRPGISRRGYLALDTVDRRTLVYWLVAVVVFVLATDLITFALDRAVVPPSMIEAYETARVLPLFWLAVVGAAPLFEEIFFRGFMFRGIEASRAGPIGVILVTAVLWTLLHRQYDAYHLGIVFSGGLLFGLARWRTGSAYLTVAMHMTWNAVAMLEVALGIGYG